jgi:hypothetical protein
MPSQPQKSSSSATAKPIGKNTVTLVNLIETHSLSCSESVFFCNLKLVIAKKAQLSL